MHMGIHTDCIHVSSVSYHLQSSELLLYPSSNSRSWGVFGQRPWGVWPLPGVEPSGKRARPTGGVCLSKTVVSVSCGGGTCPQGRCGKNSGSSVSALDRTSTARYRGPSPFLPTWQGRRWISDHDCPPLSPSILGATKNSARPPPSPISKPSLTG